MAEMSWDQLVIFIEELNHRREEQAANIRSASSKPWGLFTTQNLSRY